MIKRKTLQPRLFYPAKLSFKIEGEIKSFLDKKKEKYLLPPNQYYKNCYRVFFMAKKKKEKKRGTALAGVA